MTSGGCNVNHRTAVSEFARPYILCFPRFQQQCSATDVCAADVGAVIFFRFVAPLAAVFAVRQRGGGPSVPMCPATNVGGPRSAFTFNDRDNWPHLNQLLESKRQVYGLGNGRLINDREPMSNPR